MTALRPVRAAGSPPQDITDPATGLSRLLSDKCATCILRPGDKMHLGPERLRAIITQTLAAGTFVACHDTLTYGDFPDYGSAICRGFYDAYAGQSPALIILRACHRLTEVPPPGPDSPDAPARRGAGRLATGRPEAGSPGRTRSPGGPGPRPVSRTPRPAWHRGRRRRGPREPAGRITQQPGLPLAASNGERPAGSRAERLPRRAFPQLSYSVGVARYDMTLSLPAVRGAWLDSVLADRLGAALRSLPAGTVRAARLVSRTQRGYQVTRVKVDMSVTAPDMATATGAAVDALTAAAASDAGSWDLAGLTAEIRPAPLRPAPQPARGRAGSVRPGR